MRNDSDGIGCLFSIVIFVVFVGVSLWSSYAIATSNLPDWMKFLLLR